MKEQNYFCPALNYTICEGECWEYCFAGNGGPVDTRDWLINKLKDLKNINSLEDFHKICDKCPYCCWAREKIMKIYAKVFGEVVNCWVPIQVECINNKVYSIRSTPEIETDLEINDIVKVKTNIIDGNEVLIVKCQVVNNIDIYRIDGEVCRNEEQFHNEISSLLGFFNEYGKNLDALSDVLSDSALREAKEPFELLWLNSGLSKNKLNIFQNIVTIFNEIEIETDKKIKLRFGREL